MEIKTFFRMEAGERFFELTGYYRKIARVRKALKLYRLWQIRIETDVQKNADHRGSGLSPPAFPPQSVKIQIFTHVSKLYAISYKV